MQARNLLLFVAFTLLIFWGWFHVENYFWPRTKKPDTKLTETDTDPKKPPKPPEEPAFFKSLGDEIHKERAREVAEKRAAEKKAAEKKARDAQASTVTKDKDLLDLGSADPASKYHLHVRLDPRGAAVRSVLLNKFLASDDYGQPTQKRLELVPADDNRHDASFYLMHLSTTETDDRPFDELAKKVWTASTPETETVDGRTKTSVRFTAAVVVNDVKVTIEKIYSLAEGEYHLGLEVRLTADDKTPFRYQLAGAHGLPVEGKWYTGTFRNALIASIRKGNVERDIQDLRQIGIWGGGRDVKRDENRFIRYAGVAVQYFASVIVVDNVQEVDGKESEDLKYQTFLAKARPTLEAFVLKGKLKDIDKDRGLLILETDEPDPDTKKRERTIYALDGDSLTEADLNLTDTERKQLEELFKAVQTGKRIGLVVTLDSTNKLRMLGATTEDRAHPLWHDDITVRVATERFDLKPDSTVVHRYLLYHGPVKPYLLGMPGKESVAPELVARYIDKLSLNTLTDYQSPGWLGSFSSTIFWTDLLIKCTNMMHWVLSQINRVIPNYGLCIICLTILVRGLMFPISRKQALTSIRMQALAPEMKKLQEKFKDDRQALGAATMELYRKNGVNPFGTCWFILLQMPIFMGLYFALQESIYFRLASAWPTWITNLAAPDMLVSWGENIPWLSRPEDYGGYLYLGPFFNLLPVIAVGLMIAQQKMMTPPPQDEQQEMQQKVMKYMMIIFGLLFYKVAAGLCIYFIASSIWGFAERKLLPKKSLPGAAPPTDTKAPVTAPTAITTAPAVTGFVAAGDNRGRGRKQGKGKKREEAAPPVVESTSAWSRFRRRVGDWWSEMQKKADKK